MQAVEYDSIEKYITTSADNVTRIERVKNIIAAMELQMLAGVSGNGKYEEYNMDSGQTKIKVRYASLAVLAASLAQMQAYYQRLIALENTQRTGRVVQLRDHKNFN